MPEKLSGETVPIKVSDMKKLTEQELEALAEEYAVNPPVLSGKPGYFSRKKEQALVTELLGTDYARVVNAKAKAMSVTPSEVIRSAIKEQFANAV
jgi:hypothetical protein